METPNLLVTWWVYTIWGLPRILKRKKEKINKSTNIKLNPFSVAERKEETKAKLRKKLILCLLLLCVCIKIRNLAQLVQ